MKANYRSEAMRALSDQQIRYAPRERKLAQIEAAEQLIGELDERRSYSFEYVCYRVTGYRPEALPNETMTGEAAVHDLRLLIEDLSDAANLRVDDVAESVYTIDELANLFNVSKKTISRWRQQGLVSRRFLIDGRKRVGFLQRSVDRFVKQNRARVRRGERFSQLSDDERQEIIRRARRLARAGGGPMEVSRRIARRFNRSVETIRSTLRQFDERHPSLAVFPGQTGPLTADEKRRIYQQFRQGKRVEELTREYRRSRTAIYRVIHEARAERIMELPLDYIYNEEFSRPGAYRRILAPAPEREGTVRKPRVPAGLPQYLASLYEVPLLTAEQERHLFRKFNYLKYRAAKLRERLDPQHPKVNLMDRIEELYERAVRTKNQIVQANLRLVVSIAKRHVQSGEDFFGLVSDGNVSLIRAVEKFDYGRGFKFSTYASWAIMKNFARSIPEEFKHRDRFRTAQEEMFLAQEDCRTDEYSQLAAQRVRKQQIRRMLGHLDEREQRIIIRRFGLDPGEEPLTLKEVGRELGVTKERIRQIEARALSKLRVVADEERIELLDD